jgi:hypothetical protein
MAQLVTYPKTHQQEKDWNYCRIRIKPHHPNEVC